MTTSAFPFLFGRAFVEAFATGLGHGSRRGFPFLFGRAFIEAFMVKVGGRPGIRFPFLFGRAFIEVPAQGSPQQRRRVQFPFLMGRAFIEAAPSRCRETEILAISLQLVGTFNKTRLL